MVKRLPINRIRRFEPPAPGRRLATGLTVLLLLLPGCTAPGGTRTPARATNAPVVQLLALGDSYTSGEGVEEANRWTLQLAARLRAAGTPVDEPTLIAQSGWTTAQLAERLSTVRLRVPFDLVTLLIGTNNQFQGRDTAEYRADFRNLVGQAIGYAGGRPGRLLVLSLPDWGATPFAAGRDRGAIARGIDIFNAINRQEAAAAGARYLDITPGSRQDHGRRGAGGAAPTGGVVPATLAREGCRRRREPGVDRAGQGHDTGSPPARGRSLANATGHLIATILS